MRNLTSTLSLASEISVTDLTFSRRKDQASLNAEINSENTSSSYCRGMKLRIPGIYRNIVPSKIYLLFERELPEQSFSYNLQSIFSFARRATYDLPFTNLAYLLPFTLPVHRLVYYYYTF